MVSSPLPPLLVTIDDADVLLGQGGEEATRATGQLLKELQRQREQRGGKVMECSDKHSGGIALHIHTIVGVPNG